jgi:sulfur-carrier protein
VINAMSVRIHIPASMRKLAGGEREVMAIGETVEALIGDLDRQFAGLKDALCDETGRVRRFVAVFVDGVDIRALEGLQTTVGGESEVDIVSALAGG